MIRVIAFLVGAFSYPSFFDCNLEVTKGHDASCSEGNNIMQCDRIMGHKVVKSTSVLQDLPTEVYYGQIITLKTVELFEGKGLIGVTAGIFAHSDSDCAGQNAIRVTDGSGARPIGPSSVSWSASAPAGTIVTFTYAYAQGYGTVTRGQKSLIITAPPQEAVVSHFFPAPDYNGTLRLTGAIRFEFQFSGVTNILILLSGIPKECASYSRLGGNLKNSACGLIVGTEADCSDYDDDYVPNRNATDPWPILLGNGNVTTSIDATVGLTYGDMQQRPIVLFDHHSRPFACTLIGGSSSPTPFPAPAPEKDSAYPFAYFIFPIVAETLLLLFIFYCICRKQSNSSIQHTLLHEDYDSTGETVQSC